MNVSLNILSNYLDSYLYMGKLFIISQDNHLKYIDTSYLFEKYLSGKNEFENEVLEKVFFGNRHLSISSNYFENKNGYKDSFDSLWKSVVERRLEIEIEEKDFTVLCSAPDLPVLDFKFYGERVYYANRQGLFECHLDFSGHSIVVKSRFKRVFSAKAISLSARMGEFLISSSKDGLFRGSLWGESFLKVDENPVEVKSIRAAWTNVHFMNYENDIDSKVFFNEIKEVDPEDAPGFLKEDNPYKQYKVDKFAVSQIDVDESLSSQIVKEEILFTFNSLGSCFFLMRSGEIQASKFQVNGSANANFLGKVMKWPVKMSLESLGKPLSSHIINNGTIFEFYNAVFQLRNAKVEEIFSKPVHGIRTFPSSLVYKNVVCLMTDDTLSLQSVHPYSR